MGKEIFDGIKTSGWGNHCGLASLSDWFIDELARPFHRFETRTRTLKPLFQAFKEVFEFEKLPSANDIKALLSNYPHPYDKQAICSLAFRRLLDTQLKNSKTHEKNLQGKFIKVARLIYFSDPKHDLKSMLNGDYVSIILSNLAYFQELKQKGKQFNYSKEDFTSIKNEISQYWHTKGFARYCHYVGGNLQLTLPDVGRIKMGDYHHPPVSSDELSELCKTLRINLSVYGATTDKQGKITVDYQNAYKTARGYQGTNAIGELKTVNKGLYWERVIPKTTSQRSKKLEQKNINTLIMSPALAHKDSTQKDVVNVVKQTVKKKSAKEFTKAIKIIRVSIRRHQFQVLQEELQSLEYINEEVLNALNIPKLINSHKSRLLVLLMSSHTILNNIIVQKLLDNNQIDYLGRLLEYKKIFVQRDSMVNQLSKIVPYYDNWQAHAQLETIDKLKKPTWIGYRTEYKNLKLTKSKKHGFTVLHSAIVRHDEALFKIALNIIQYNTQGASSKLKDIYGHDSLDIRDERGMTPLHYMCQFNRLDWLQELARYNVYDSSDITPDFLKTYRKMLDISLSDKFGNNALHHAVLSKNTKTLEQLINWLKQNRGRYGKSIMEAINQVNCDGFTPVMLALDTNQYDLFEMLLANNFFAENELEELYKEIPKLVRSHNVWSLDCLVNCLPEDKKQELSESNYLVEAIKAGNYKAVNILLHPFNFKERQAFVSVKYNDKTAFEHLLSLKQGQDDIIFNKLGRLLAQYDPKAYQWAEKTHANFQFRFKQDLEQEMLGTRTYQVLNYANIYGEPALNATITLFATCNPWAAAEAGVSTFFRGNALERVEKTIGLLGTNDSITGKTLSWASTGLNVYGWYKNTTLKATKAFFAETTAQILGTYTGQRIANLPLYAMGKNHSYLYYLEFSSGLYFASGEVLAGRFVGPELAKECQGLESFLNEHYEVPKIEDKVTEGFKAAEEWVQEKIGFKPSRTLVDTYLWLRQNVGRLSGDDTELYLKILVMTPREFMEYVYGTPEDFRHLFGMVNQFDLAEMAVAVTTGESNKQMAIAEVLALWFVGLEDALNPMTNEDRESLRVEYVRYFYEYQINNLTWKGDGTSYIETLASKIKEQTGIVINAATTGIINSYYQHFNVNQLADELMSSVGLSDDLAAKLKPGITAYLSTYGTTYQNLYNAAYYTLCTLTIPSQSIKDVLSFVTYSSALLVNENYNIGYAYADMLCPILLHTGFITQDQYDNAYDYIIKYTNANYHNDQTRKKTDFAKAFYTVIEQYFQSPPSAVPSNSDLKTINQLNDSMTRTVHAEKNARVYYDLLREALPDVFGMEGVEGYLINKFSNCRNCAEMKYIARQVYLLFSTSDHMWDYLAQKSFNPEAMQLNNQYNPREVRAAFAVNWVAHELENTKGYNGLTNIEKLGLYDTLCSKKTKKDFSNVVFDSLKQHCHTPNKMPTLSCRVEPAEFTAQVESSSLYYGENRWGPDKTHSTSHMDTRKINQSDPKHGIRKAMDDFRNALTGRDAGVRFSIGYNNVDVNFFNLYGIHADFNQPVRRPQNSKVSSQLEASFKPPKSVVFRDAPTGLGELMPVVSSTEPTKPQAQQTQASDNQEENNPTHEQDAAKQHKSTERQQLAAVEANKVEQRPTVSDEFDFMADLEVGFKDKILIGSGRAFVKTGQGLKQLWLICGEKLGLFEPREVGEYTKQINQDKQIYDDTPVGKSKVAKAAEIGTDIGLAVAVPVGSSAKGAKLVAESAGIGAAFGMIEPTEEGTLSARAENAAIGAAGGAGGALVVAKVTSTLKKTFLPLHESRARASASIKNSDGKRKTYNEIKSLSTNSALDGSLYPSEKIPILVNYLEKRGVHVYCTNGAPCFIGRKNGVNHIYLPENPTVLQVKHELSHWLDFKNLGFEQYSSLSTYQREKMVLDRLQSNRLWKDLNILEKEFSTNYVDKIKRGYKPGGRNDKR